MVADTVLNNKKINYIVPLPYICLVFSSMWDEDVQTKYLVALFEKSKRLTSTERCANFVSPVLETSRVDCPAFIRADLVCHTYLSLYDFGKCLMVLKQLYKKTSPLDVFIVNMYCIFHFLFLKVTFGLVLKFHSLNQ